MGDGREPPDDLPTHSGTAWPLSDACSPVSNLYQHQGVKERSSITNYVEVHNTLESLKLLFVKPEICTYESENLLPTTCCGWSIFIVPQFNTSY